jgi:predicted transcriptional regulator
VGNEIGVYKLFFELASESRLGILRELQSKDLKMQEVARKLDLTDTEACRQLQRLSDAKLVEKQLDGKYILTAYAKLVLNISSPLDFVSEFSEYFLTHDASPLPSEFRARFNELSRGKLSPIILETMNRVAAMLRNSTERIDCTIEVGGDLHIQIMLQRLAEGLKVRWLIQESFLDRGRALLLSATELPEIRVIPRIPLHLYLTEKEAACCLRTKEGTFDYSTFFGQDSEFLKWTNDLYNHEWQKAKPWHR